MRLPIIRTSERRDFGRCPWRWHQAWRRGLVPLGPDAPALLFGSWVHEALAAHYCGPGLKRGPHPAETFEKVADADLVHIRTEARSKGVSVEGGTEFFIEEKLVPATELGPIMLQGYIEWWGNDDSWSVIEPERSGEVLVLDPNDRRTELAYYGFTYDLIYRDLADGRVKLGEHKTAKAISIDHLPVDPQAGSYWAVAGPHLRRAGLIGPKEEIAGITYNFLRKALPDERPKNANGHATNLPKKEHYIAALAEVGIEHVVASKTGRSTPVEKATIADLQVACNFAALPPVLGDPSSNQPKPLFEREFVTKSRNQRQRQIDRIGLEALEMNALRGKPDSQIRKNPTRDCHWDCRFFALCVLDEEGGDTKDFRREVFRVRDPYANHRKSTEE